VRFALEAGDTFPVVREGIVEDFESDFTAEPGVAGAVDATHPARPKGSDDVVGAEPSAGGEGHEDARCRIQRIHPPPAQLDESLVKRDRIHPIGAQSRHFC
jgi:hypothetical protein